MWLILNVVRSILPNVKYTHAVIGGTFDHFHAGHELLLSTAIPQSEHLTIALSTEKLYRKKFLSQSIEAYDLREERLKQFFKTKKYSNVSYIPLNDIYGNTLIEKDIDAIFVTEDTFQNAEKINKERKKIGFPEFKIVIVPFMRSSDKKIISSERIRYGEIDREGNVYMDIFEKKNILHLPESLRQTLKKPFGKLLKSENKIKNYIYNLTSYVLHHKSVIITVGDISSLSLKQMGYHPDISIIDFRTRRNVIKREDMTDLIPKGSKFKAYKNDAGTISKDVINIYKKAMKELFESKEKQTIVIDGEEDLLTLPVVMLAPLNASVFYGQYDQGLVVVEVTEEKKKEAKELLRKFLKVSK